MFISCHISRKVFVLSLLKVHVPQSKEEERPIMCIYSVALYSTLMDFDDAVVFLNTFKLSSTVVVAVDSHCTSQRQCCSVAHCNVECCLCFSPFRRVEPCVWGSNKVWTGPVFSRVRRRLYGSALLPLQKATALWNCFGIVVKTQMHLYSETEPQRPRVLSLLPNQATDESGCLHCNCSFLVTLSSSFCF